MSKAWHSNLAASVLLVVLGVIALGISTATPNLPSPVAPSPVADMLEKRTFGGTLDAFDYAEIRRLVAAHHGIDGNIIAIEIRSPEKVEVRTGPENLKPLSGGGDILILERNKKGWALVEKGFWVG